MFSCEVPVAVLTDCDIHTLDTFSKFLVSPLLLRRVLWSAQELALTDAEFLTILDWIARDTVAGKRSQTPVGAPPIFERLGIDAPEWSRMVKDFGRTFKNVAGKPTSIEQARSLKSRRRFYESRV